MARRFYSSTAQRTTITSGLTAVATTIPIAAAVGLPATYPYTMILDPDTGSEEIVEVTNRVSLNLTVTRGVDGTTATTHSTGAFIQHGFSARDFDEANGFLNGATAAQGPILISAEERCNIVAAATTAAGTFNFDVVTAGLTYYTTASTAASGWTLNIRGNSTTTLNSILAVGDSVSLVFLNTTGAVTTSYPTTYQIDGVTQTPKWQFGAAITAGNASSIDAYTITIIKTAATPTYTTFVGLTRWA